MDGNDECEKCGKFCIIWKVGRLEMCEHMQKMDIVELSDVMSRDMERCRLWASVKFRNVGNMLTWEIQESGNRGNIKKL